MYWLSDPRVGIGPLGSQVPIGAGSVVSGQRFVVVAVVAVVPLVSQPSVVEHSVVKHAVVREVSP